MVRHLLFFTVALFFLQITEAFSQISIGTVDPGPYGNGSTITVPINFPNNQSEFKIGNVFTLYISDATGNFAGNGTQIGTYTGFYTPFINGILPNLPIGSGYKLRIVASNPAQVIDVPGTIDIRNITASPITITPSLQSRNLGGDNLGWCPVEAINGQSMMVKSNASNPSTVTITIKDLKSGVSTSFNEIVGTGVDLTGINLGYYSVTVTSITNIGGINIKSIRSYFLHNTPLLVNIQDSGQNIGCINGPGQTATVSFELGLVGGIYQNYPGTLYRVDWGDGTTSESTLYEIVNNASRISHQYTRTSCGEQAIPGNPPILNSFKATINAISEICNFSRPATAYAQVFINPIARISPVNSVGCINTPIRFTNASTGGTRANCSPLMDYTWYVDGVKRYETSNTDPFDWTFTTKGVHTIKLVASNGVGVCLPSEFTTTICIQEPPRPAFDITTPTTGCAPFLVKVFDKSFIDPGCSPPNNHTYNWIVTNANGVRFTNFNNNNPNPEFNLTDPGVYTIALEITSGSCGPSRTVAPDPIVIINGQPTAILSDDKKLCTLGTYKFDNTPNTVTTTTLTGTQVALPDTYTWTVTDNNDIPLTSTDYTFEEGTGPNSKYPSINFKRNILYKITVIHKNTCNPSGETDSQTLEFFAAPQINAGSDQNICFIQNSVTLNATITGITHNGRWVGGAGTFGDRNNPSTTYIPTAAERSNGLPINLTFTAETELADPCTVVSDALVLRIKPEIKITSPATANKCTGFPLNYSPTSNLSGTVYKWVATGSANASGYTNSASPTIIIQDILVNSDPINNATVTYLITPINDGCDGNPFTLTVTVTPLPKLTVAAAATIICSGKPAGITMTSNLAGTSYTWFSSVIAGTVTGNTTTSIATTNSFINDILDNTGSTQASVKYTITPISASGCQGTPEDITIFVDPPVTVANPGFDESICATDRHTLNGNTPIVGTGNWTIEPANPAVTIANPTSPTTLVTGLTPGQTYVFRWTISAPGACDPSSNIVTLIVNEPTIPGTTSTPVSTVCENVNTGIITLTGNLGSVLRWESSLDGITWSTAPNTNTTTTFTFNNLTVPTQFRAVVQNGGCTIEYSSPMPIAIAPKTTIANAGPDQILCAVTTPATTVRLDADATLKTGETGRWNMISNTPNAIVDNPNDPKSTVSGITPGLIYKFAWIIFGNSPCGISTDTITINNLPPIRNIIKSTDAEVCNGKSVTVLDQETSGGDGLNYLYSWESSSDGINWLPVPNQTGKELNIVLTGTISFRRIVISIGCPDTSNIIRITVQPPISNNQISANQDICIGQPIAELIGTPPSGSNGQFIYQWQSRTLSNNWTNITTAIAPNYTPGALTETTLFRRIVSTSFCMGALQNVSDSVTITVRQKAKAEFTYASLTKCAPFKPLINTIIYPQLNNSYTWYADNVIIGNSSDFPSSFSINESNKTVRIKLVTTSSQNCESDSLQYDFSTIQDVPAVFTASPTNGCGPLTVNFVNSSIKTAGAFFSWDFGNGQILPVTDPPPIIFQPSSSGIDTTYKVKLYSKTDCGIDTDSTYILVRAKPKAIFSPDVTIGCSPLTVIFRNNSPNQSGVEYVIHYGDGFDSGIRTNREPATHTYYATTKIDTVKVFMTAKSECGTDTSRVYDIIVSPKNVTADLVVSGTQKTGCAPFTVDFDNNSTGATQYIIDFKDGFGPRPLAASKSFQYEFKQDGEFDVMLIAKNECSADTTFEKIIVHAQPKPMFEADVVTGCPNLPVTFKNTTQGNDITSYLWDFGDGSIPFPGFEPPTHIFSGNQELYTVTLKATNALGCSKTQTLTIHIVQPPIAAFRVNPSNLISIPDYTFNFQDESTNNPTIWEWDFGDGTSSALKNPSHTYLDTGTYNVILRVENQQGCFSTYPIKVTIKGVPGYLFVPNSFIPGSDRPELRLFRAKGSGIQTWRFSVFNKWGQVLWDTTKLEEGRPTEGWDGTFKGQAMPQGVYYWKIDVQMVNGTEWKGMTYDKSAPKRTGAIHLIR